jgi:hypothetical protein
LLSADRFQIISTVSRAKHSGHDHISNRNRIAESNKKWVKAACLSGESTTLRQALAGPGLKDVEYVDAPSLVAVNQESGG